MHRLKYSMLSCLTALWLVHGALGADEQQQVPSSAEEQQATQDGQGLPEQDLFPPEQIEQLVAPIALYPDALLAQILMAATYPLDIVQAARWMRDQGDLEGEALEKAAEGQAWDPSVKTLVFFPDVLGFMNDNLDWTQDLGDAMLAQKDEIMDAVQRLRMQAQDTGSLKSTEQQRVETEGDTIVVQPADPKVVYVPTYDPSKVYGQTTTPAVAYYPATYTTPVATTYDTSSSSSDNWINFGTGALVGGLLTAAILWDRNDYNVYYGGRGYYGRSGYWGSPNYWRGGWKQPVNINRNVDISRGDVNINRNIKKWEHNPERRGGVRYRGNSTRQKYVNARGERVIDRDVARGRDPNRQRPKLAEGQRPGGGRRPDVKPGSRPGTKPATRPAAKPTRKPAAKPAKRPAAKPTRKPATKPAKRPAAKPTRKPAAKPARKPAAKPAQRPAAKRASKPATRQVQRPAKSSGKKSSAFKVDRGKVDRAASQRGAKSRGGNRTAKRGSGGGHSGGGGARRGGGGRRK